MPTVVLTCWSVKGGSGTTVVAAALASMLALRCPDGAVLVDAGGDASTVLGLPDAAEQATSRLRLVRCPVDAGTLDAVQAVQTAIDGAGSSAVVVDAGPPGPVAWELAGSATVSLLVLRPCYLALRRAVAAPVRPSAVVLVDEPGRSLHADDVEDVLGVPVRAVVPWARDIARAVDAGLFGARVPRLLATALRAAA